MEIDKSFEPIFNTHKDADRDNGRKGCNVESTDDSSILKRAAEREGLLAGRVLAKSSFLKSNPRAPVQHTHHDFHSISTKAHVEQGGVMPKTVLVSLQDWGRLPIKVGNTWYLVRKLTIPHPPLTVSASHLTLPPVPMYPTETRNVWVFLR